MVNIIRNSSVIVSSALTYLKESQTMGIIYRNNESSHFLHFSRVHCTFTLTNSFNPHNDSVGWAVLPSPYGQRN